MNVIRIKRRVKTGDVGAPDTLANGELAFNEADNTLYYGWDDDGSGNAVEIIPIAGDGMAESIDVPLEDGTASCGDAFTVSRSDHIHPTDTSRAPIDSPTFTGTVTLPGDPTQPLEAATKQYVDDAVSPDAPIDTFTYGRKDAAWEQVLPLTGGVLSGPIVFDRAAGVEAKIDSTVGGLMRWRLALGNPSPEVGGNAGCDFAIARFADNGDPIDTAMQIFRQSGVVQFSQLPLVNGVPIGMVDAPADTYVYGRKDTTWVQAMPLVGGQPPAQAAGSGLAGTDVVITSGMGDGAAGSARLIGADAADAPGNVELIAGNLTGAYLGSAGTIKLQGGNAALGSIDGDGGSVQLTGGSGEGGIAGSIKLAGGIGNHTASGGPIEIIGGSAGSGSGGSINLTAGDSDTSPGNIVLNAGKNTSGTAGNIIMVELPTTSQADPEAIWNNAGVLNIGAGGTSNFLPLTGGVLDGDLVINGNASAEGMTLTGPDPVLPQQVATKRYVDAASATGMPEAPVDSFAYGRKDAAWEQVLPLTGGILEGDLMIKGNASAEGMTLSGPDPVLPQQVATKAYVDAALAMEEYLPLTGGTLTGALLLQADPTDPVGAATKHYVDHVDNMKLNKFGDTMTGPLVLSGDPVQPLESVTKQYVDAADALYLPLTGGVLGGDLVINGNASANGMTLSGPDPVLPQQVATKAYVDAVKNGYLPLTGGVLDGDLVINGNASANGMTLSGPDPVLPQQVATKGYVDAVALTDAPADNFAYGRKDGIWEQVLPLMGGVLGGDLVINGNASADGMTLSGPEPVLPQQVVTKAYVDAAVAPMMDYLPLTGGIIDGDLLIKGNASANSMTISGPAPVLPQQVATKGYVDAAVAPMTDYLPLKGGVMTGTLSLAADPVQPLESATKQYVDAVETHVTDVETQLANYLPLSGGALTGAVTTTSTLTLAIDPVQPLEATTKSYVDNQVLTSTVVPSDTAPLMDSTAAIGSSLLYARQDHVHPTDTTIATGDTATLTAAQDYADAGDALLVPLAGGTMTGPLVLSADPTDAVGAATKQYVDTSIEMADYLPLSGGTMLGALTLVGDPANPLTAATKQYVDAAVETAIAPMTDYLPLAGGAMTGSLALAADALLPLEPITLQQMQASDAPSDTFAYGRKDGIWEQVLPLTGGILDGDLVINGNASAEGMTLSGPDPVLPQQVATKAYVDAALAPMGDYLPLSGGTLTGDLMLDGAVIAGQTGVAGAPGGDVNITAGLGESRGGAVTIVGGYATPAGPGGAIAIIGGDAQSDIGGSITLTPGVGGVKNGSIILDRNSAVGNTQGDIIMLNLPTTAPADDDAIWNNAGVLNIGAGGASGSLGDAPSDGSFYGRRNAGWVKGLPLSGGVMAGGLELWADPTQPMEAATKAYVDAAASTVIASDVEITPEIVPLGTNVHNALMYLNDFKLAKTGDQMAGPLILALQPTQDMEAATKYYVDNIRVLDAGTF